MVQEEHCSTPQVEGACSTGMLHNPYMALVHDTEDSDSDTASPDLNPLGGKIWAVDEIERRQENEKSTSKKKKKKSKGGGSGGGC